MKFFAKARKETQHSSAPQTPPELSEPETMWHVAIRDAQQRIKAIEAEQLALKRQHRRLTCAVTSMRQLIRDGVPWPVPGVVPAPPRPEGA